MAKHLLSEPGRRAPRIKWVGTVNPGDVIDIHGLAVLVLGTQSLGGHLLMFTCVDLMEGFIRSTFIEQLVPNFIPLYWDRFETCTLENPPPLSTFPESSEPPLYICCFVTLINLFDDKMLLMERPGDTEGFQAVVPIPVGPLGDCLRATIRSERSSADMSGGR